MMHLEFEIRNFKYLKHCMSTVTLQQKMNKTKNMLGYSHDKQQQGMAFMILSMLLKNNVEKNKRKTNDAEQTT